MKHQLVGSSIVAGCAFLSLGLLSAVQETAKPAGNIPPDQSMAERRLKESPRHGEWVDVALSSEESGGGGSQSTAAQKIKTWVVYPERKDKAPVVVVIHEIFGLTDWVRAVADQLAADGFIAVAPDLLSGKGPNGGGTESFEGDKVREAIRNLSNDEVAQRLNAVRDYGTKLPAAAPKTASIGFCWGGSASFNYAAAQLNLNAAVVYYGTGPAKDNKPDTEVLAKIKCPVLGFYGGNDARVTSTVESTAKAMADLKKRFTHHIYEGAGHGFLRQQLGNDDTANSDAASKAWAATIAFLRENLK